MKKVEKKSKCKSLIKTFVPLILGIVISLLIKEKLPLKLFSSGKLSLTFWSIDLKNKGLYDSLLPVKNVFSRLGYEEVNGQKEDWDVLWSIQYPFLIFNESFKNLEPHQKINHFPGINHIAHKVLMATKNKMKYILPAFHMPENNEAFEKYRKANPNVKFVEKNNRNRGIKVVSSNEINYDNTESFYQVFMDNPMLIDGHAFDFGVFVLISSINPLRIYRFKSDNAFRFCALPYHPFNKNIVDKYVVGNNIKSFNEMPSLKDYHETFGFSFIESFEHHMTERGQNVTKMWQDIDDAIVSLLIINEKKMLASSEVVAPIHHFFELLRFDFLFDKNLNVYLMEVNMSPDLRPYDISGRFDRNNPTREQLVYNALKLVGAGNYWEIKARNDNASEMISNTKNIAVNIESCIVNECIETNCQNPACKLCIPCMSQKDMNDLHRAYREHMQSGEYTRLYPKKLPFAWNLTPANDLSVEWFKAKCKLDKKWC